MNISELTFDPSKCFIGGEWVSPRKNKTIPLTNPSNGKIICNISRGDKQDIDDSVQEARKAFEWEWGNQTAVARGRILMKMSAQVMEKADHLAKLEAIDVGKPLKQAKADALALGRYMEFYGGAADKIHGETIPYLEGYTVYTMREAHGVTGHIVPWNYPMQIIGRSVGAALAMGNAVVLKPAEEACLTALAFAEIAQSCGLPAGVLNVVPGFGEEAGAALASHNGVDHLSFTGSVHVGSLVQSAAAKNVIPVTLELGGKSPQLVFDDADLDRALPFLINAGIQNAGQTCSASSRILIHNKVYKEVSDLMRQRYEALQVGAALNDLDVGPLISKRQKDIVNSFIRSGDDLEKLAEGQLSQNASQDGYFVRPTLFGKVPVNHKLAQEEIFGPVQTLIPFKDEEDAIEIANGTDFGLVSSIWTTDGSRQMRLAKKINTGQVFINNYGAGGGVELPFGGVKKSGHGREKGFEALYGFSKLKTVAAFHG